MTYTWKRSKSRSTASNGKTTPQEPVSGGQLIQLEQLHPENKSLTVIHKSNTGISGRKTPLSARL